MWNEEQKMTKISDKGDRKERDEGRKEEKESPGPVLFSRERRNEEAKTDGQIYEGNRRSLC